MPNPLFKLRQPRCTTGLGAGFVAMIFPEGTTRSRNQLPTRPPDVTVHGPREGDRHIFPGTTLENPPQNDAPLVNSPGK